nr:cytochrome b6-f complex subunit 7 [Meringosphaera mediterranea]WLD06283.1 cytochrome b6-f complex subunit 7 [Meringosphaera mediterranea]
MEEILTTASTCFGMTLFGISLGFALLKLQGE